MIQRDGELRAGGVKDMKASTVHRIVRKNVASGSTLMTDEHRSFRGIGHVTHHAVSQCSVALGG